MQPVAVVAARVSLYNYQITLNFWQHRYSEKDIGAIIFYIAVIIFPKTVHSCYIYRCNPIITW